MGYLRMVPAPFGLRYSTVRRAGHTRRVMPVRWSVMIALVASLLAANLVGASAGASDNDDLNHRKNELDSRIDQKRADLDEVSSQLITAQNRFDDATQELGDARARLVDLRVQLRRAARFDRLMQVRLAQAVDRLRNARGDLVAGQRRVEDQRRQLTGYAVTNYSATGVGVLSLGSAFDGASTRQAVDSAQDAVTVLNKQTVGLQRFQADQVLLTLIAQRVEDTRDDVSVKRAQAADNLRNHRLLTDQAVVVAADVRTRVRSLRVEKSAVATAKRDELARLDTLQAERDRVEDKLRRIAERRAERRAARQRAANPAPTPTSNPTPTSSGGYLSYPVANTYITSPYGMRMHPILHVYKLHDGTDFHADCGTPVYAAADGTVISEYFNTGYGNRVIIDHGYVDGVSLATSYNHLTSFVAGVGSHVSRGQLIAYSGTTGYSTGCHLHFMVYVNGGTVDPVTWL